MLIVHALEIYLEKLWTNGGFGLLNKPLEPYKLPSVSAKKKLEIKISAGKFGINNLTFKSFIKK